MQIKNLKRITHSAKHHAFTDLCDFKDALYCCFRVAKNHISDDGRLYVLKLSENGQVRYTHQICMPDTDLRDPKLSVTPKGELLLLAYARRTKRGSHRGEIGNHHPMIWVSQDGLSWSSGKNIGEQHWWLWRIRWHRGKAYGFAYNRAANSVNLYTGDPKRSFHPLKSGAFNLQTHHKGYPNESDMCFCANGTAYTILRRDSDTFSAQFGISNAPYTQWQWLDLGFYLGGPTMLLLNAQQGILAGRIVHAGKCVTAILSIELTTAVVSIMTILPSSGDNSYPGMVKRGDTLFVSYYSSHQDEQAHVYLAQLTLNKH